MKRYRREIAESDEDSDLDEDEREALKAFKADGFDPEIANREAERLQQLDKEAEDKRQREEEEEAKKRAEENEREMARRRKEEDERAMQAKHRSEEHRPDSPMRRVVFVGNLVGASPAHLVQEFEEYGTIVDAHIPKMKSDIGFVEYSNSYEAADAVSKANGKELFGRALRVSLAKPRGNLAAGSDKMPGGGMTQAERIATWLALRLWQSQLA